MTILSSILEYRTVRKHLPPPLKLFSRDVCLLSYEGARARWHDTTPSKTYPGVICMQDVVRRWFAGERTQAKMVALKRTTGSFCVWCIARFRRKSARDFIVYRKNQLRSTFFRGSVLCCVLYLFYFFRFCFRCCITPVRLTHIHHVPTRTVNRRNFCTQSGLLY